MSNTLFDLNPDLRRLRDEGFHLALSPSNNHLVVHDVPYVSIAKTVQHGKLVAVLECAGDLVNPPKDHTLFFVGEQPCDVEGKVIAAIVHSDGRREIDTGLYVDRMFSGRPATPFTNLYDKITNYVAILEGPARAIDSTVTARTHLPYEMSLHESVFRYADTASSRARIGALSKLLAEERVAIIGLGGTGSYILDFVAKTPVKEIHVFDKDVFSSHNAYRAPGAASLDELRERPSKAAYHKRTYEKMRHQIVAHEFNIDNSTVGELDTKTFVFVSIDGGKEKRAILDHLLAKGISFVDVGMGLALEDDKIDGVITTTTSTPEKHDHIGVRISCADVDGDADVYGSNIQVAELNALNAALAVIRWKKLRRVYASAREEHFTVYTLRENSLINEDLP